MSPARSSPAPTSITFGHLAGEPAEAYTLEITEAGVLLRAGDREGLIWGLQTLRQLLPAEVERPLPRVAADPGRPDGELRPRPADWLPPPGKPLPWPTVTVGKDIGGQRRGQRNAGDAAAAAAQPAPHPVWSLPCLQIADQPRYEWRGLLLDSCRHFQQVAAIERLIDLMSLHKLNRLHWHLTEDQGWRLEIKARPLLTEIGAWRVDSDGVRYGGFYTREEARHVVAYAAARGITVVPEIELPGHCRAALAAYPELSCRGIALPVETAWGVFPDIYCAGNDAVFSFLEEVLTEVLDIFPSPFIHLGGDECPPDRWSECPRCRERMAREGLGDADGLHGWFVQRMARWLADRGRRLIGWDEILAGGLAPGSVVQSWRGFEGALEALRRGHDAIVSPISHVYLDQDLARVGLETVLGFEPEGPRGEPATLAGSAGRTLGGEMCVWTEWIPQAVLDERVFPRACGGSEALWSPRPSGGARRRDVAEFRARLVNHSQRLRALGVAGLQASRL
jgi:hexosaminidase